VVDWVLKLLGLFLVINYFLCICIVLLHLLVLCGLYHFLFTYGVSFGPLEVSYRVTRVFVSGWIQYFGGQGLYWVLFNSDKVNQWFQYNNLKVFLGFFVMWIIILLFVLIIWIAYILERDTEDVDEVLITFKFLFIKVFFCLFLIFIYLNWNKGILFVGFNTIATAQ
jgi:hypothetical protein